MGNCIFLRKGSVHEAPSSIKKTFADNDWATIIQVCQEKAVPDTWIVGDQKAMTINGTSYLIDIIGKNHDEYSDGSGNAPLTFQLHNLYETKYQMCSSYTNTGWGSSTMQNTHLPAILSLMPTEVQGAIRAVNKLYRTGTGNKTTKDKLFCLSEWEIFGNGNLTGVIEGKHYEYYVANASLKKTTPSGLEAAWWSRSRPSTNFYFYMTINGTSTNTRNCTESYHVAPAFCF